ncbi:MAG: peptidoglycan glycosyltransferase [Lachnospiraceae bacterium]|nr:peptidoglycan glycosyltransferase [Lachnospiraceae bacterium]
MHFLSYQKRGLLLLLTLLLAGMLVICGRLAYFMIFVTDRYAERAKELHERERSIKAERGLIYDRNGVVIADNKPVCTISVIHNQITNPEEVIAKLSEILELSPETVRKRVEKYSSIERIKANVPKETADKIRDLNLDGVMVDEDYKRFYPYGTLASRVLGFTGSDNQGIIGLEVEYDSYLQGTPGKILTLTTAHGLEIENAAENRVEPIGGNHLHTSLDVVVQQYAEQAAEKVYEAKGANRVSVIVMNPQNGEIYAMVNIPEFDLNAPYTLTEAVLGENAAESLSSEKKNELLNAMWRNPCINDTYEPGSAFKIVTATAALEEGVVSLSDRFYCPGYKLVEDRTIRCHKVGGHGSEDFKQGIMNSCNPVFMEIGARIGAERFLYYYDRLGLTSRTGVDLPGEANSILHKLENIKAVELATMSFGQSFQITPLQLMRAASAAVNGGRLVTPHFGVTVENAEGVTIKTLHYEETKGAVSEKTSRTMQELLEAVVAEGTGKRAYVAGLHIGGKTATSEKLPRRSGRYIASFLGFAPAADPQVMVLVMIDEPEGIYYGGTIAAPVAGEIFENILPYLGIVPDYSEKELEEFSLNKVAVPDFTGKGVKEAKTEFAAYSQGELYLIGEGERVKEQFPLAGEEVNENSDLILYLE